MQHETVDTLPHLPPAQMTLNIGVIAILGGLSFAQNAQARDITDAMLTDRSATCAAYADSYSATATDVQNATTFKASVDISVKGDTCEIASNAVPNHDFNAEGQFASPLSAQT